MTQQLAIVIASTVVRRAVRHHRLVRAATRQLGPGQFCTLANAAEYRRFGYECVAGDRYARLVPR